MFEFPSDYIYPTQPLRNGNLTHKKSQTHAVRLLIDGHNQEGVNNQAQIVFCHFETNEIRKIMCAHILLKKQLASCSTMPSGSRLI